MGPGRFIKHIEKKETMVKTATFNKVQYEIDVCGPIDGFCNSPRGSDPVVRICTDLKTRKGLITVLHESLHAEGWAKSEEVVDRTSREIGALLWRLGFRLKE